ncbi:hypothetical protein MKZ15_15330 [Paenibacillus sp. FSL R7-0216]|uniref:hypothetical protein n=1 Tax=Paenibacillus sp. FSL R7-0216 TaxID=2921677 RepID=UPI0030D773AC
MNDKSGKFDLALEALVQTIPYVGGPLATLYFGHKQEKRFKRLESFYSELKGVIENITETLPDISTHDPDELSSIIENLHEKIETEHIEQKRNYYKIFYLKNLYSPVKQNNYDKRMLFLNILGTLTPNQIELLIFFVNQQSPVIDRTIGKPGVEQAVMLGHLSQLKLLGLVDSQLNGIVIGGSGNGINESVQISSLGREFHKFCLS